MQIQLTFALDEPLCIPLSYSYQLQSSIYSKLAEIGLSDFWHDEGYGDTQVFKMFTFSPLSGSYRIIDKKICFENEISFEVRSPIFEFCDELQRSFEVGPYIKLFDTRLDLVGAGLTNLHFNDGKALFSAASPVIVHTVLPDGKTEYFYPNDDCFIERLKSNYKSKFEAAYEGSAPEIDIQVISEGKKVVTKYKNIWFNGNKCELLVKGDAFALEFIYNTGLGEKNSQGFGFVTVK